MGPASALPCQIVVTPTGSGNGSVHLEEFLYATGGLLLRQAEGEPDLGRRVLQRRCGNRRVALRADQNRPNPFAGSTSIGYAHPQRH